jgi:hypothetical protein
MVQRECVGCVRAHEMEGAAEDCFSYPFDTGYLPLNHSGNPGVNTCVLQGGGRTTASAFGSGARASAGAHFVCAWCQNGTPAESNVPIPVRYSLRRSGLCLCKGEAKIGPDRSGPPILNIWVIVVGG